VGATQQFASFAAGLRPAGLSEPVREQVRRAFLDTLAVTLAGAPEDCSRLVGGYARSLEARPEATILGGDRAESRASGWLEGRTEMKRTLQLTILLTLLVARATRNAAHNGIGNARFLTADLTSSDWGFYRERWDVVVLDPPRTGAAEPIAELHRSMPRRVVYVSCHPATLARDAATLVGQGFGLRTARVFDMFPHTHHIEALAVFERD